MNQTIITPEMQGIVQPILGAPSITENPIAIAAAETAKAMVAAKFYQAIRNPRDLAVVRLKILENCRRPQFAIQCRYKKPVGKGFVTGPTIRFAEMVLRCYGNVDVQSQLLYEDQKTKYWRVSCLDLETCLGYARDISVAKVVERKSARDRIVIDQRMNSYKEMIYLVLATEDEILNKESAGISKVIRNDGLRLVPGDAVEEGMRTSDETVANKLAEDPASGWKIMVDSFAALGIYPADIREYVKRVHGKSDLTHLGADVIQDLRGVYQAIRDGEAKWTDYIEESPSQAEDLTQKFMNGIEKPVVPPAEDLFGTVESQP